jgi:hypothetical protein
VLLKNQTDLLLSILTSRLREPPTAQSPTTVVKFVITNIQPGRYTLITSFVGFVSAEQSIDIVAGETISAPEITLHENTNQLKEIVVTGERSYHNDISSLASKSTAQLKDIPQAVSYVTKELLQDQKAFRITDVVKNISGVNQESITGDLTIRGFGTGSNIMINGLRISKGWTPTLISNLERVEIRNRNLRQSRSEFFTLVFSKADFEITRRARDFEIHKSYFLVLIDIVYFVYLL